MASGPGSATSEDFFDDAAIKAAFESDLSDRFTAGGLVTGAAIVSQLRHAPASVSLAAPRAVDAPAPDAPAPDAVGSKPPPAESAISRARAATLIIGHLYLCGRCEKHHASFASGVLLSSDGLALTNYHVLDSSEAIVFAARTADGRLFSFERVLAASKADDLALIRLRDAADLPFIPLGEALSTGDELFLVSHPDGHFYSLSRGHLSRKYLAADTRAPRLQITADFAKGSSGAGIFDRDGRLVGLATSTNSIYHSKEDGRNENLQMVVKSGVPLLAIRRLFGAEPE